jgi:hypothetical protein
VYHDDNADRVQSSEWYLQAAKYSIVPVRTQVHCSFDTTTCTGITAVVHYTTSIVYCAVHTLQDVIVPIALLLTMVNVLKATPLSYAFKYALAPFCRCSKYKTHTHTYAHAMVTCCEYQQQIRLINNSLKKVHSAKSL